MSAAQADDVPVAWDVVLELAKTRVSDRELVPQPYGDMLLAEFGTYDWGHGNYFRVSLSRQFSFVNGEDSLTDQVRCEFRYEPTPEVEALGAESLFTMEVDYDMVEFERRIRSWHAFGLLVQPVSLDISYEEI